MVSTLALVALFGGNRFSLVLLLCQSICFENYMWAEGRFQQAIAIGKLLQIQEKDLQSINILHIITWQFKLCRQGLAYRGHNDDTSNFIQLLKLRCDDIPDMRQWLENKGRKYTSHDIQNEMVELMGQKILHQVIDGACKTDFY